jgi:hypothetical protein
MNAHKIAALYPYFLNSLRHINAAQTMESLLCEHSPGSRRYSIALTDVENPGQHSDWLAEVAGVTIQEFAPERVFNWVRQHLPTLAAGYQPKPATGWHLYLQASNREQASGPSLHLYTSATSAELAPVLRGLRAYQAKRRKRAHRILAQLRVYHAQQLAAKELTTAAPLLSAGHYALAISCYGLTTSEYHRRLDLAEDLEEQLRERHNHPDGRYGREIMWHPAFADDYVTLISETALTKVTIICQGLAGYYNQGRPLDLIDYGYLRDLLIEALADNPTPLAALRLARALAWVEQAGAALTIAEVESAA